MALASWKGTWIVSKNGAGFLEGNVDSVKKWPWSFSEIERGSESPWTRLRAGWWEGADLGVAHARDASSHFLRGEDRNRETVQKSLELDSEIIDGTGTRAGGVTPLRLEKKATRNLGTKC